MKDAEGNIALHEAVRPDEPEALTTMLDIYETMKRDADINEQNNRQETVLHLAAKEGFHEHISRLVLFGADLSVKVGSVTEGGERQRQRDRDRETETKTETERHRESERERQSERERGRDRDTERAQNTSPLLVLFGTHLAITIAS